MSADPASWKVTLPCTRAEAEAIDAGDDHGIDPAPVLMTTEEIVDDAESWRLDAYFEGEPTADAIAAVRALAPSAAHLTPVIAPIGDADWVTMSQAGLEPLRVGRFFVHTGAHPSEMIPGGRAFLIEAGQAFGTGHHETTAGCLAMLDGLSGAKFANVVDLGTGTGLLAFAAAWLWPAAKVMATDIDRIAIEVTRENAAANDVAVGYANSGVELIVADGTRDARIAGQAPFDLVIANILAGPLIAMAPEIAAIAAPGGTVILAGLVSTQFEDVAAAYRAHGCAVEAADVRGDWTIVRLRAGAFRTRSQDGTMLLGDRGAWATDS